VYAAASSGDACSRLETLNSRPANLRSVKPELVRWTNDGLTIDGPALSCPETVPERKSR